jgi:hypothetical protein
VKILNLSNQNQNQTRNQDGFGEKNGYQGGHMSFSGQGYHDSQEAHHRFDNRLTTIEETTAAIQGTLHSHTQWQATMGHEMANLQQQQQ